MQPSRGQNGRGRGPAEWVLIGTWAALIVAVMVRDTRRHSLDPLVWVVLAIFAVLAVVEIRRNLERGRAERRLAATVDATSAELDQRQHVYASLIRESFDVVAIVGADGLFTYASPSLERVLGRTPSEVEGVRATDLVHPDDVASLRQLTAALARVGETARFDARLFAADGTAVWMDMTVTNRLDDPALRGFG